MAFSFVVVRPLAQSGEARPGKAASGLRHGVRLRAGLPSQKGQLSLGFAGLRRPKSRSGWQSRVSAPVIAPLAAASSTHAGRCGVTRHCLAGLTNKLGYTGWSAWGRPRWHPSWSGSRRRAGRRDCSGSGGLRSQPPTQLRAVN